MQPLSFQTEMKYQHNRIGKVQSLSSNNSGVIYELHHLKKKEGTCDNNTNAKQFQTTVIKDISN